MRNKGNESVYSEFERELLKRDIKAAIDALKTGKGSGVLLRNLNYIISRCESKEDINYVYECIDSVNTILLIQLYLQYCNYKFGKQERFFKFAKNYKMKVHRETRKECRNRKSRLNEETVDDLKNNIKLQLEKSLKNKLGKVYIEPGMENYGLPISESTSRGGFGVLAKGSRIHIGSAKKIRAFTYWELVDDIDLSLFGLDEDGNQKEFSWRTMADNQSEAITYSGDETSGYNGGSEYFDIDLNEVKNHYPNMKYVVCCDNVYSRKVFDDCICKAGYMIRDVEDSGEVFEPKTVKSAFRVNGASTFAYLFAIDLSANDFVWLNILKDSNGLWLKIQHRQQFR